MNDSNEKQNKSDIKSQKKKKKKQQQQQQQQNNNKLFSLQTVMADAQLLTFSLE
jgi:hypothetical protein